MTDTTTQVTQTEKPKAVLVGGPLDNSTMGGAPAAQQTEQNQQQAPEKVIVGGKEFNSPEEAITHFKREQQQSQRPAAQQTFQQPQTQQQSAPVQTEVDPATIIFENPALALKMVEERAYKRAMNDTDQAQKYERNRQQMWTDFYSKNKDLAQTKEVVEGEFSRKFDELKDLRVEDALDIIAASARKTVGVVKRAHLGGTPLQSGPAKVSSASGAPVQSVQASKPAAKTFVEEVMEARRRKA